MKTITRLLVAGFLLLLAAQPLTLRAHCDTLEGPVIVAAREALLKEDVTPVLKWVKAADENLVRAAFSKTVAVRKQSAEARILADTWFFETLVRIHRAGEGAPFTGLKSGVPEEPGIAAADHALISGDVAPLLPQTTLRLEATLKAKLEKVRELRPHAEHNVSAGREYVAAYVDYVHFAERLASLSTTATTDRPAAHNEHNH
ncbi:MAG: DUF6448 family protein [Nibricoccus sp.]